MNASRGIRWYYGWNIVAVCVLAGIVASALPINAFSLFLADWSKDLDTPISTLQLGLAAVGIGSALLSPLAGLLADKWPTRRMFALGLSALALFCVGIGFMTETWHYILLYAVPLPIALAFSASIPANAVVSRWFVRRLGLALAITAVGLGMAGVVMPPIVAAIMPDVGWRAIWITAGIVIGVLILPLILLVLRDRPAERDGLHYLSKHGSGPSPHAQEAGHGLRWRDIFARRTFWLLVITYLPMIALYGAVGQNLAPIAAARGLSLETAGALLSAFSLSQVVATLLAGLLSDRFGNRLPLAGFAFATALGGVVVAYADGVASLGLGVVLAAIGGSFWPLLAAAIATEFGAAGTGRAFGLITVFLPATALAPFSVAKAQEMTGNHAPALLGMAALALVTGALCGLLMRERGSARRILAEAAA